MHTHVTSSVDLYLESSVPSYNYTIYSKSLLLEFLAVLYQVSSRTVVYTVEKITCLASTRRNGLKELEKSMLNKQLGNQVHFNVRIAIRRHGVWTHSYIVLSVSRCHE